MSDNPLGPRSSIPLTFGGKTYVAAKFNIERLIELERWMRRAPFELFREVVAEKDNDGKLVFDMFVQREMLAQAWDCSQDMLMFSPAGMRFWMYSIEGITRAVWIAVRVQNPTVTFAQVRDWLPPEKVDDCTAVIAELMGKTSGNPTPPASGPDKTTETTSQTPST